MGRHLTLISRTKDPICDAADHAVEIVITDVRGRLGDRLRLLIHREGRTPNTLYRSFFTQSKKRARYYGWLPKQLITAIIVGDELGDAGNEGEHFTWRRITTAEVALRALLKRPKKVFNVVSLLCHLNFKGAAYRFARLTDELNAASYQKWINAQSGHNVDRWPVSMGVDMPPPLVLVTIEEGLDEDVAATRRSLTRQTPVSFREVSADQVRKLAASRDNMLYLWTRIPAGMILADDALERMVEPFLSSSAVKLVYCDEDRVSRAGKRFRPFFKPAWNPPLVKSGWLPLDGALMRIATLPSNLDLRLGSMSEIAMAAASGQRNAAVHIPRILLHRRRKRKRIQRPPSVRTNPDTNRMLPVTVVIPTRDRADLLKACINGLFARTAVCDLEIIIIDNESCETQTTLLFEQLKQDGRVRRIPMSGAFNFAKACNLGVAAAQHELILLLNNDVEPISPHWLGHMIQELEDPDVGAVGALLLFPDGFVQHAGVTLGAGSVARHSFHFVHPESGEDNGLLSELREVSAATAACLLTRRKAWQSVEGMDEEKLAVAFNDVDYCLKLRRAGFKIMWTPEASLWHRESVSRGTDNTDEKLKRFALEEKTMHERWGSALQHDPFYNPNLSLIAEDYVLEAFPRDLSPRTSSWD
jgi:GT2 family glycosyltransferase